MSETVLQNYHRLSEALAAAEKRIDELEKQHSIEPRWIPVTERLPEEFGNYLVTDETLLDGVGIRFFSYSRYWSYIDRDEKALYVTAWMPLPQPYQPSPEKP